MENRRNDKRGERTERPAYMKEKKVDENLIFGIHAVVEAIKSGREINKILVQKGIQKEVFHELKDATAGKNYFIQYVPVEKIDKLTTSNHQGVVAFASPVSYFTIETLIDEAVENDTRSCFLFLDRLTDVRNFGAIARTAECMGVDAIVIPSKSSVQVTSDAIKTSSGALNRIKVCKADSFKDSLFYAQQSDFRIVACTEKTSVPLYETNLRGNVAIIMGSEEDGVSPDLLKLADIKARIPMDGEISSLNVGIATGMILYERLRQIKH
ncbi:MAG: rRNA ((2251)-2-O)-methyltransferase RlmB [Crocinitomicaceae bacterium]|jgi:23S rRNA (guanosine2251-2'-O)-methyltransferase|nr:rRNA ((2251)-2-O)-methyltransferase RlmB [Crocinitomicaceae bacterium]